MRRWRAAAAMVSLLPFTGCDRVTNSPHAAGAEKTNTFFSGIPGALAASTWIRPLRTRSTRPSSPTLIYEPLYRFHYLKRPYEVVPRAAEAVAAAAVFRQDRRRTPGRCPGDQIAEVGLRHQDQKGHQLCAAPGLRQGCARQVSLSRAHTSGGRQQAHAFRFRAPGHARADRARLRLCDPPAGDDAHQVAVVFTDGGAHHRAEGIWRADQRGR